jgi:hypothetical protein
MTNVIEPDSPASLWSKGSDTGSEPATREDT